MNLLVRTRTLLKLLAVLGPGGALRYVVARFLLRRPHVEVRLPGAPDVLRLRRGTTDFDVFHQIFVRGELDAPIPRPNTILDCGAYTGISTVYLARKFPQARIIAVEPEAGNFAMLERNTARYPSVERLNKAVWSSETSLDVVGGDGAHSFRVVEQVNGGGGVPSISLSTLVQDARLSEIGLLKMDIEGSEREVFANATRDWLDATRAMLIEVHESVAPGALQAIRLATAEFGESRSGEYLVLTRCRP